jgi:uncharacterized membrane protein
VQLFDGKDEGWILLVVAGVEAVAAAALFPRARNRDLSAFLGAVALAVAAVAVALLLSGPALTIAWAAEAAVLAWLARRADELRYQIAALVYLAAAAVHALFWDAPLDQLYEAGDAPAEGVAGIVAVALAAAVFAWYTGPWRTERAYGGVFAPFAPVLDGFRKRQALWRSVSGWTGAVAALYAASLGLLAGAQWISDGGVRATFEWGHVAVAALWGLTAVGLVALGHRLTSLEIRVGGFAFLGALALHTVFFGTTLDAEPRGYLFLVSAATLLVGALLDRLALPEEPAFPLVAALHLAGVGLAAASVFSLLAGDAEGYGLLGVAAVHGAIAVLVARRDRDLSTLLWAPALVVAGFGADILLDRTWLVLAFAVTAAALVTFADRVEERRLHLASAAFLFLALLHTLAVEAPPADLFEANAHPENGIPALLLCIGALIVFAVFTRGAPEPLRPGAGPLEEWAFTLHEGFPIWRAASLVMAGLLAIYAGSLAILGLAQLLGDAGVATDFQRGHSGVSAFWGTIGLIALYLGLRRGARWLRVGGFALFGLALAKLFIYDLAFLSSVTRAFSFLAVGAVLLFGGFLVQRLGERRDQAAA